MLIWIQDFNKKFNKILFENSVDVSDSKRIVELLNCLDLKDAGVPGMEVEVPENWEEKLSSLLYKKEMGIESFKF